MIIFVKPNPFLTIHMEFGWYGRTVGTLDYTYSLN
jgi:hypothetical protein